MNIVFFGSSQFAVPPLQALLKAKHDISCVVTQPDRKKGRGLHFEGTAVKAAAEAGGLKVYQPVKINTERARDFLKDLRPRLFIVISYGHILSGKILDIPESLCINVHASLLPRYRGAAPMNWAIINGEKSTGVSVIRMVEKMDAGEIILQKSTDISGDETIITLQDKLSALACRVLIDCLDAIENNNYQLRPQDEGAVSFAPKLKKEDGLIHWDKPACQINSLIRGLMIWPGAFTYYKDKRLKIFKAVVGVSGGHEDSRPPGQIAQVSKEGIEVYTGGDSLIIQELQIEGKRTMRAEEFLAGHKVQAGEVFGNKK